MTSTLATSWLGGSARPLLLDDAGAGWRLETGYADVFVAADTGARRHLFRLEAGATLVSGGAGARFIAVGGLDSRFIGITANDLDAETVRPWIERLTEAAAGRPRVWVDQALAPGRGELAGGGRAAPSGSKLLWLAPLSGQMRWLGAAELAACEAFPVISPGWIEAVDAADFEAVEADPKGEAMLAAVRRLNAAAAIILRRREQAESQAALARGVERAVRSDAVLERGLNLLAGRVSPHRAAGSDDLSVALAEVCRAIGHAGPLPRPVAPGPDQLGRTMAAAQLLGRPVILSPDWWRRDGLPLIGRTSDDHWVALLPLPKGGWRLVGADLDHEVTESLAGTVSGEAIQVYPSLPAQPLKLRDLARLAGRGIGSDVARIALTGLAAGALALAVPAASGLLFDHVIPAGDIGALDQILIGLIAVAAGQTSFELVKATALLRLEARLDSNLQAALFDRLLRLPAGFFRRYTAGDLSQRTLGLQQAREIVSSAMLTGLLSALFGLINIVVLVAIDARLALLAVILTAAIGAVSGAISWGQLREERRRGAAKGRTDGFLLQLLVGVGKLRAAAAEKRAFAQWALRSAEQRRAFIGVQRYTALQTIIQSALPSLAQLLVFVAVVLVAKSDLTQNAIKALAQPGGAGDPATPGLSVGAFAAFLAGFGQLMAAFTAAALSSTQVLGVAPLLERTRPILETVPEVTPDRLELGRLAGGIDFRRVTFRYASGGPAVLDGLSFSIKPGEFIAIVGPSGSGKTTVLRMLLGFEQPETGQIFYDGIATERLQPASLRSQLGVVLQNGRITAGSIFSNIVGEDGGLDAAWAAARLVGLADDIEAMPMGMHTVLPDGGGTLSGGQKQRVLIARAMARRPAALLLDEATSALDNRTQAIVTNTLAGLEITRIVIAHRLSTIRQVDRILVIELGQLVEEGDFDQLMQNGGPFAALAQRQLL